MHIAHLDISNFRSITSLKLDLKSGANLLVGPNGVGKSSVLEAVRLAKAMLAPRTQNEARMVLTALGAMSATQQLNFNAIAGDPKKPIKICCIFELTDKELADVSTATDQIARALVATQQGIDVNAPNGELSLQQMLSTPLGRAAFSQALVFLQGPLGKIVSTKRCDMTLTLDKTGKFEGKDVVSQILFGHLERTLPPGKTLFSYFPADRAMATGDAQIQIGANDAVQQMESHNSQAFLKYQRLKNVIFSTILAGKDPALQQELTFSQIFAGLLKDKQLETAEVNQFGQATVMIRNVEGDNVFDIDSMSSGEKGLILTFLLIARTVHDGGLVLLDEPELHLNSGVCKNLLDFLVDDLLLPRNIQVLLCTHSPEVMTSALRRTDSSVFNMRRNAPVSQIRSTDQAEAIDAMKQLGTSEIEALLFDAVIFVEGPNDVELLEYAFRDLLSRVKFKELSGRGDVEKYIKLLVKADKAGRAESTALFIFDHDNKPTSVNGSEHVKLRQWDRYCLENYIIEPEILYDVIRQDCKPKHWPSSYGDALGLFISFSKKQLIGSIVEKNFAGLGLQDVRLRAEDKKESFRDSGLSLVTKLKALRSQIEYLNEEDWLKGFESGCQSLYEQEDPEWEQNWIAKCSGKQFLLDVYAYAQPKTDMVSLKRTLLNEHRQKKTQSWDRMTAIVHELVGKIK